MNYLMLNILSPLIIPNFNFWPSFLLGLITSIIGQLIIKFAGELAKHKGSHFKIKGTEKVVTFTASIKPSKAKEITDILICSVQTASGGK